MREHHNDQLLVEAIEVAAKVHEHQKRKSTEFPYIVHPFEVAMILQGNGVKDQEVLAAAILHDTLEDGDLSAAELESRFTPRVKQLVLLASEKLEGRSERSWKERKAHTIEEIQNMCFEGKLIHCADKLSNARSMLRAYEKIGDQLWDRFNAGVAEQKWYYEGLVKSLEELASFEMYREFREVVERIFHRREE